MKNRFIISLLLSLFTILNIVAQDNYTVAPDNSRIASEGKLSPRSTLYLYSTREKALKGDREKSSEYITLLKQWESEKVEGATKFTAKFKAAFGWSDRAVLLRMEQVSGAFEVEVNGEKVGYNPAGMGSSEFDLTKFLTDNNNTLSVIVYDDYPTKVLEDGRPIVPANFLRATIIAQHKVSIFDIVVNSEMLHGSELLNFGIVINSYLLNSKQVEVFYELLSPEGDVVASGSKELETRMLSCDTVRFSTNIPAIKRWSDKTPNLYKMIVQLQHEGRPKEFVVRSIGFRSVDFKDGVIFVNNEPVAIKSTVDYFRGDYQTTKSQLQAHKSRGINTIVVANNPQPDEFYSLCDELGLYVFNQADISTNKHDTLTTPSNNPALKAAYIERNKSMYFSSKEHPCVIAFLMARNAQNGICLYETHLYMKSLNDPRPIIYPEAEGEWNSDEIYFKNLFEMTISILKEQL